MDRTDPLNIDKILQLLTKSTLDDDDDDNSDDKGSEKDGTVEAGGKTQKHRQ